MPYDRSKFITRTPVENVCFDYMQAQTGFLADKIFAPKPVAKSTTKIYQADKSKLRYVVGKGYGTNSEPPLVDEQFFSHDITLDEYKYGRDLNPKDIRDADQPVQRFLSDARGAQLCTQAALIEREKAAFDLVTTTANYPSDLTGAISSGSRWNESGGDPESDMVTANQGIKNRCGMRANALAIGDLTLDKLMLSPYFRSRTQYTMGGPLTPEMVKAFFKVDYLFVGDARYDTGIEGGTASVGGFWSDYALAFVYNPSPDVAPDTGSVSFGHMYLLQTAFWSTVREDTKKEGPAGAMRRVTVGTEYQLGAGFIVGDGDTDFSAGYLFRTVVA